MQAEELATWVRDARDRTFNLAEDLDDDQLIGPRLEIVNPPLWELGHVAWFQEKWVLRHACGRAPLRSDADEFYDSAGIPHDVRWNLPLAQRGPTFEYLADVRDAVLDVIDKRPGDRTLAYFVKYSVFHEDMHAEAFAYTRQTLGYPPPPLERLRPVGEALRDSHVSLRETDRQGDASFDGGEFLLGARESEAFVFDNEKWAHPVRVAPFAIAQHAVTQSQFAGFVEDGGYGRRELWSEAGWKWREEDDARRPIYWRQRAGGWQRRLFGAWRPLEPNAAMVHVNFHEAQAFCRWAGRRLPSEAEWEFAAAQSPEGNRRYPWGEEPPSPAVANLDWRAGGPIDVAALPSGDSAAGCRQMIGNVWEWTASDFGPYPGFTPDAYREYSQPWFGTHKSVRGGSWATSGRLVRNTLRSFYLPERRDVWTGFRTCALES